MGSSVMKWDAMDLYLPWKYYVTETLNEGILPLWNPSLNGGFPQMGDPGTWYPISWILGWCTGGYGIFTTQLEYLFHLMIAGMGMYTLVNRKIQDRRISLLIGCAFMFSGVFIANAQHIGWIVGAAWLPWIIYYFEKVLEFSWKSTFPLALMLFLQISGGYPAFFFITAYILLFMLVRYFIVHRKNLKTTTVGLFLPLVISAILFLCLSCVVIYSSFDMVSHINRGTSLAHTNGIWNLLVGSFEPQALVSLILPLVTLKNEHNLWGIDISMTNAYIGAIVFILTISQLFFRKGNKQVTWYFIASVFFLVCALGTTFPIRGWIASLPMLDTFRFPTLFRLFANFYLLLAAGYAIKQLQENAVARKLGVRFLGIATAILAIITGYFLMVAERWRFVELVKHGLQHFLDTAGIREYALLQLLILVGLLIVLLLIYWKMNERFKTALLVVCLLEICIATWLHSPVTIMAKTSVAEASKGLEKSPDKYQIPSNNVIANNDNDTLKDGFTFLWRNIPIYKKVPSHDGHSPYSLLTQLKARDNGFDTLAHKMPVVYIISDSLAKPISRAAAPLTEGLVITAFNANKISVRLDSPQKGLLFYNQNYYPHWKARSNVGALEVLKMNENYMAVQVNPKVKEVTFYFEPPAIKVLFLVMIASLVLILATMIFWSIKKEN